MLRCVMDPTGLQVEGIKDSLQEASKHLVALGEALVRCNHTINKTGMPKYFKSERGQDYLASLENRHSVSNFSTLSCCYGTFSPVLIISTCYPKDTF